ncbi:PfkB family carbohydrate kinase [Pedobacter sp. Leaf176]|uniref:PfkB family carbohydrate kinase n=1 Tax=Pedobacter sp. Leaf176 TaxID=1736286 RepID=UPI0006FFDFC5|nr:PfkB family carbohydrate kinase [Pedobacter sp. Leaf176]KQR67251.1 hypothetical protein ASF92_16205 [Pedobacter sp. Leaf176]
MSEKDILNRFKSKKVIVIGELIVDAYLQGTCNRIAPEATVPVVDVSEKKYCLGGAANVAANLKAMGADVSFLSVCGNDEPAELAFRLLKEAGLKTDFIVKSKRRKTLYKTRVSSGSQLMVRFDEGSTNPLDTDAENSLKRQLERLFPESDAIFIADYAKGIIGQNLIDRIAELNVNYDKIIALDAKNYNRYRLLKPDIVKPNYVEAMNLLGLQRETILPLTGLKKLGKTLYEKTAADLIILTADANGIYLFEKGTYKFHKAVPKVQHPEVSGAGDTFLAAAMLSLSANASLAIIANLAIAAAHYVVKQPHTSVCGLKDLEQEISGCKKLFSKAELQELCKKLKSQGKRIVFTNGCFDILHSGHVSYLRGSKEQGDVLVVGLNNDDSIRRLKGSTRPINSLSDRMDVLAELNCIDYIVSFGKAGDDTPVDLIKSIKPAV